MAQFDVHRLANRPGLVIDCQADRLDHLESRLVAPLVPLAELPSPARRLNPVFPIEGEDHAMLTQAAAAIRRRELGPKVVSLADHRPEIMNALDFLLTGV
jgi:CcdB protein.